MTLRQGCRRRTPWWCWLIAIGAAALTLPGAAFVVSAQDESPQKEAPLNDEPVPLSALNADDSLGRIPPVPVSTVRDGGLQVYQLSTHDSTITTAVYETADFDHLLTGTQNERQQKFERLVRSRNQARDAQINWFDRKPIVRTTNAGHRAVRECLAVLVGSETTAKHFEGFLDSVEKRPQETIVIDLQFVTMGDESYSNVEDAVIEIADNEQRSDEFPLVMPTEKWDVILEAAKQASIGQPLGKGVKSIANPRLAVSSGRTIHIESVTQYPPVTVRSGSPYRTHGGSLGAPDWTGWKALALPYQRNDGSFWLGMRFEVNSLVEPQYGSAKSDESNFQPLHHEVGFDATLREGQVVVLWGLNIDHSIPSDRRHSTFLAARIRKSQPSPVETRPAVQPVSRISVNSDAGAVRDQVFKSAAQQKSASTAAQGASSRIHIQRQLGPVTIDVEQRGDGTRSPKLILKATNEEGRVVFTGTGDAVGFRDRDGQLSMKLSKPRLRIWTAGGDRLEAQELRLLVHSGHNDIPESSIRLELDDAAVWLNHTVPATSHLKADRISLVLNAEAIDVEQIDGEGLKLLKTDAPVVSRSEDEPEEDSWDDVMRRRIEEKTEGVLKTSNALPLPSGSSVNEKLSRKMGVSFQDTPLVDAIQMLRLRHDLNIIIDGDALADEGLTPERKVSLQVSGVSLRSVLKLILKPLNLGIQIRDDGVIVITNWKRVPDGNVARAYPVADLVVPIPHRVVVHAEQETGGKVWKAIDRKDGVVPAAAEALRKTTYDFDQLIDLIQSVVEPRSWDDNGGRGTIESNETTLGLVVRQTQENHEQISDLLNQLRRLRDISVELQTELLTLPADALDKNDLASRFVSVGNSSETQFLHLPAANAERLRLRVATLSLPKVTLLNGQTCNLSLPVESGPNPRLIVRSQPTSDRRYVRLALAVDDSGIGAVGGLDSLPSLPDGDAVLIKMNETDSDSGKQRFLLLQPRIVIVEEEEELLGPDLQPLAR